MACPIRTRASRPVPSSCSHCWRMPGWGVSNCPTSSAVGVEERIRSLIASISRGFPVGAVMKRSERAEGRVQAEAAWRERPRAASSRPESLLLDGQQRLTSLYQVLVRRDVVATLTRGGRR